MFYYVWALRVDSSELGATRTQLQQGVDRGGVSTFLWLRSPTYRLPPYPEAHGLSVETAIRSISRMFATREPLSGRRGIARN